MPVNENASQLTMAAEAAISTMQNAMKMAFRRPMTVLYAAHESLPACATVTVHERRAGRKSRRVTVPVFLSGAGGLSPERMDCLSPQRGGHFRVLMAGTADGAGRKHE